MDARALGLSVLLDGPYPALWDAYSKREVLLFLQGKGSELSKRNLSRLVREILRGPPRIEYVHRDWNDSRDHEIYYRLVALQNSGAALPRQAVKLVHRVELDFDEAASASLPEEPVVEDFANFNIDQFGIWANRQRDIRWDCSGGWKDFCSSHPKRAIELLKELGDQGEWILASWYDAISAFGGHARNAYKPKKTHHRAVATALCAMPSETLAGLGVVAAWWLERFRKGLAPERLRLQLWLAVWQASELVECPDDEIDFDMTLNHPAGVLAAVLVDEVAETLGTIDVGSNPGFPAHLKPLFDTISAGHTHRETLARVRFAANLSYLYHANRDWACAELINRMNPHNEADFEPTIWEGYLWSPRIDEALFQDLKAVFFAVLENTALLPESVRDQAPQLFMIAAIPPDRGITTTEAQVVLQNFSTEALSAAAQALRDILLNARGRANVLWTETLAHWFQQAWPKHEGAKSSPVSHNLVWMAIDSGSLFPKIFYAIEPHLVPESWGDSILTLKNSGLAKTYPVEVWRLLQKIVGRETNVAGTMLADVLDDISTAKPLLARSERFKRMRVFAAH